MQNLSRSVKLCWFVKLALLIFKINHVISVYLVSICQATGIWTRGWYLYETRARCWKSLFCDYRDGTWVILIFISLQFTQRCLLFWRNSMSFPICMHSIFWRRCCPPTATIFCFILSRFILWRKKDHDSYLSIINRLLGVHIYSDSI